MISSGVYVGDDMTRPTDSEKLLSRALEVADRIVMPGFAFCAGKLAGRVYLIASFSTPSKAEWTDSRKLFLGLGGPEPDNFAILKAYLELAMECLGTWVGDAFLYEGESIFRGNTVA